MTVGDNERLSATRLQRPCANTTSNVSARLRLSLSTLRLVAKLAASRFPSCVPVSVPTLVAKLVASTVSVHAEGQEICQRTIGALFAALVQLWGPSGRNADGLTRKRFESARTWFFVSDRVPFRTAEIVDCEIPTFSSSALWVSPFALISSRSTSASETSTPARVFPHKLRQGKSGHPNTFRLPRSGLLATACQARPVPRPSAPHCEWAQAGNLSPVQCTWRAPLVVVSCG